MKKRILFIACVIMWSFSWGQMLKADGKRIVNASGEEVLLRGIGPGGWQIMEGYMMQTSGVAGSQHEIREKLVDLMGEEKTDTFFQKWRENHFTKQDVDSLAAWGFNSIRIPMHYNLFTLPIDEEPVQGENTWIETGFELIDNVLEWAAPYDMYVILDMHATPGGQGTGSEINDYDPTKPSLWESQENKDKLVALWTRIAERYKDNPWIGGYDLINETHWDLPGGNALRNLYVDITNGIRSVDTNHVLFIEGNWYANDFTGLTPPWDDNIVYSFHKYWSYNNPNDLDWILWLREEHNVPLWMGESGENSNTWFTDAVTLFENNNIGWAWWTMRKIGDIDSPYAVDINPGYQKIIDYWGGKGPKPTEEETFDGMMQLADNLLVENSRFRKDVPDALIRQVQTIETKPYHGNPSEIPGVIYSADFDLGQNNHAYFDVDVADYNLSTGEFQAWNRGWSYRNDGVDIEKNDDELNSNGFHVAHVAKGEWLKYTVNIAETGVYTAAFRVASERTGGAFYMSIDDEPVTQIYSVNTTSSWSNFRNLEKEGIILEAGEHTLKFHFTNDIPFNISSMNFIKEGDINNLPLTVLNGETRSDEKSVMISLSEELDVATLTNALEHFVVKVNGDVVEMLSVESIEGTHFKRSLVIELKQYLTRADAIAVSYNGTTIKSTSDKLLQSFEDLAVVNNLSERFVIPTKIEVEDYDYMEGLGLEDTEDVGGGKNFGYTDPGDFADYSILVPIDGTYRVFCRVAGYDAGKIGFFIVDESGVENEVGTVTAVVTGGWQTWDTATGNLQLEAGSYKLRMKIISGGFNFNWFEFGYPDSDGDGVFDDKDQCPDTPEGKQVDISGCEIFNVPSSNFMLKIASETCNASNDGSLEISVEDTSYNYAVSLTREGVKETNTFNSEVKFENLSAGTYQVCFTIAAQEDYEQCFDIVISEPPAFKVEAKEDSSASKVTLTLEGGERYFISLNEELFITDKQEFEIALVPGINELKVTTNNDCQGVFAKTFMNIQEPRVFPNPVVDNQLFIATNALSAEIISVEFYSVTGALLSKQVAQRNSDVIRMDVSNISNGIFFVRVVTASQVFNFKVVK